MTDSSTNSKDKPTSTLRIPHPSEALEFTTIPSSFVNPSSASPLKSKAPDPALNTLITPIAPGSEHYEFFDFITSAVSTSSAHTDRAGHDSKFGGLEAPDYGKDDLFFGMQQALPGVRNLAADTAAVTEAERDMTFWQGLRLYPKAILWSALLSATLVMEGYDLSIINGFYALPEFAKRYGVLTTSGDYQVTPAWQAGLTNGAVSGEIVGLLFNGMFWPCERFL